MNKNIFYSDLIIALYEHSDYNKKYFGEILLKLRCQSCNREIPYDEKYVKENLLYAMSDWTKCLCSCCTGDFAAREKQYKNSRKNWKLSKKQKKIYRKLLAV